MGVYGDWLAFGEPKVAIRHFCGAFVLQPQKLVFNRKVQRNLSFLLKKLFLCTFQGKYS